MKARQNIAAKLLNKWLFATTQYLDSHGNHADANLPMKVISASEMKTSALMATSLSLAFALAKMPLEAGTSLYQVVVAATITGVKYARHMHSVPKEFYFDTQPSRKREIDDPVIIALLKVDQNSLKKNLLSSTAWTVLPAVAASIIFPPVAPMAAALTAPLFVNMVTDDIGKWWRADQALKGNWNVITFIPTPEAKETMTEEPAAMPIPAPRMMS